MILVALTFDLDSGRNLPTVSAYVSPPGTLTPLVRSLVECHTGGKVYINLNAPPTINLAHIVSKLISLDISLEVV